MADGSLSDKPQTHADLFAHEVTSAFYQLSTYSKPHSRCNRTCQEIQAQDHTETIIDLIIDVCKLQRDVQEHVI